MIRRALELRDALDTYAIKLNVSKDVFDQETFQEDYLSKDEQNALEIIKLQLEPLFNITKNLEGNAKLKDTVGKASHSVLWEVLPVFEYILSHFEKLEKKAKVGDFQEHPGIQSSITLTQNKAQEYYAKTDVSVAQIASLVLHP